MIKLLCAAATALLLSTPSMAGCIGTGIYKTCYDYNTGNSYSVQKFGNTTRLNGYNARTGSQWSQNSQRYGNTTVTNGYDADGNSWSSTSRKIGNSTYTSGFDSDGNYFSTTCNATFGCY